MYGHPLIPPGLPTEPLPISETYALLLLFHLCSELWHYQDWLLPDPSLSQNPTSLTPGQVVYYCPLREKPPLKPKWKGPAQVIMCTLLAAKLKLSKKQLTPWIHISRLKPSTPTSSSGEPMIVTCH
ncbi:hypothetical protein H1C71_027495 [Ictidomys tridecemlineatus]|nr:hypothetical protein H1C71_027495 [Ictidomys tridecemlineatus]